jgi:VIT1/CCC1 family predicted Fe2+/Mn2+ transporter
MSVMEIMDAAAPTHVAHRDNHTHRDVNGGWLRPAVFGAMDGLVSNLALMTGVAGGAVGHQTIVITGLAGLAAGAFSMAAGEYVSVRSQAEQAEAEIEVERAEIARRPKAEERELAQMYVAKGLDPELARQVARQLSVDPERALDAHVREELGLTQGDLPSATLAAGSSFASFAVGAFLPVLPYLLGATELLPAALVAAVGAKGTAAAEQALARTGSSPLFYISYDYGKLMEKFMAGAGPGPLLMNQKKLLSLLGVVTMSSYPTEQGLTLAMSMDFD